VRGEKGEMECWSFGVLEFWSGGEMELWSCGVRGEKLEFWSEGEMRDERWSVGVLE